MDLARKTGFLQKLVFELRYRRGYLYLDKCGRTVDALMTQYPEWVLKEDSVSPQNAPLISLKNRCVLNFSPKKLDLALEMQSGGDALADTDIDTFAGQVEGTSNLIIEELGLKEFDRIGLRIWYLFPFTSMPESRDWLTSLGLMKVSDAFQSAFGKVTALGMSIVFDGPTNFRVAANQVERTTQIDLGQEILNVRASKLPKNQQQVFLQQMQTKKRMLANPEFAVMIDVDAFKDDPVSFSAKEFIRESFNSVVANLKTSIA